MFVLVFVRKSKDMRIERSWEGGTSERKGTEEGVSWHKRITWKSGSGIFSMKSSCRATSTQSNSTLPSLATGNSGAGVPNHALSVLLAKMKQKLNFESAKNGTSVRRFIQDHINHLLIFVWPVIVAFRWITLFLLWRWVYWCEIQFLTEMTSVAEATFHFRMSLENL